VNILLSIVIPHKNTPIKLKRLLDSIPKSSSVDVIVVDDNSSPELGAKELAPIYPHVRFFANDASEIGAGSARNYGLERIQTDWVVFADADDYFVPGGVDIILTSIRSASLDDDIIFFDVTSVKEIDGTPSHRHLSSARNLETFLKTGSETGLRYGSPSPWGKAIRVSMIEKYKIRFDTVPAGNDVMFSLLCGHHARTISGYPKIVYCVTQSADSLTASLTPQRALSRLDVLVRRNNKLLKWKINQKLDWGGSYFLRSLGCQLSLRQLIVYWSYFGMMAKRAFTR
jgi:glycosyltransferase involved in cell wall biosynthesis